MPDPTAALVVDGLVKRYNGVAVVDGLSLTAERGAVTAVLGPNGAGKTTTIETCEGYRTPDAGAVTVLGLDPWRDAAQLRPRVGVMLQTGGVYGSVSPREALAHAAALYAHPHSPATLLEHLGLGSSAGTPFKRLSGGQQQRLGIALAIIGRPELVFLDEPTAGLDPQSRHATWQLINDLRAAGVAVVLTTHYLEEAEHLADHVVIADVGKVVAAGSPQRLTALDGGDVVLFSAQAGLVLTSLLERLPTGASVSESAPGSYRVTGAEAAILLAALTAWCSAQGVQPTSMATQRRTLQDVFLEMTGKEPPPMSLDVAPRPGAAPPRDRVIAHARLELAMMLRNGEQLLLTVAIPLGLLLALSLTTVVDLGVGDDREARLDVVVPGMLALAVLSTAFTSLAIQTGFERRYAVLKRLGATPLSRSGLLGGKAVSVLVIEAGQFVLLVGTGWLLGWRPNFAGLVLSPLLMVLGTAAFAALGLLLAGTLRAEATLAGANVVYLALLGGGGIVVPVDRLPDSIGSLVELLPSAALADALREACTAGGLDVAACVVLVGWFLVGAFASVRWFRWE